ncbi:MAG: phage portal protein [Acidimicrobiales bacterium]
MTVRSKLRQQRGMPLTGTNWYGQWGDPSVIPPNSAYNKSIAGVVVNERSVLSLMAVSACIRIIGDSISNLFTHTYRMNGSHNPKNWTEVEGPDVLYDPYADMDVEDGNFRQIASLGLNGNIYKHIIDRTSRGLPSQVEVLNPSMIKVEMVDGQKIFRVGAIGREIPAADVVQVPWMSLAGGLVGLNPIEIGAMGLGIASASEEYAARYYAQGMHPSGILSVSKPLLPDDAKRLKQELLTNSGGLAQSHVPIVLDADAKWQQISMTPESSQLLSTRAFSRIEIAGFYGVPSYLLQTPSGEKRGPVSGIQELAIGFALFSLNGYSRRLDRADTALLPPGFAARRKVSDLFKTTDAMLATFITKLRMSSLASANELRPLVDLPPSNEEGADSLFAPLNSSQADWMSPKDPAAVQAAEIMAGANAAPATAD